MGSQSRKGIGLVGSFIYRNYKGDEVNSWSYSSGQVFAFCREKFRLTKIAGWRQKGDTAASKFGVAIEDAIQHFHANEMKPESGVDHFKFRWIQFREVPNLIYKEKEGDWKDFYQAGSELMALYELLVPTFPIVKPDFQLRYNKEVFPGTELAGISDQGFVDMISRAPWSHPMLPKVDIPKGSPYRPVILDIKVSGKMLDANSSLVQLDPQLRRYGWLSGVHDAGFLWFHRTKPNAYEKGTEISFLKDHVSGKWTKGLKALIYEYDSEKKLALVIAHHDVDRVKSAMSEIKGKGSTDRKNDLISSYLIDGTLTEVSSEDFTKQRIRFVAVRIPPEDIVEEGRVVAKQIVEAKQAADENFWPKDGAGVRFPKNSCVWCEQRGNCLKDQQLRDALLVQIKPSDPEPDWIDDLEESE
jgi:hypothetical protein